MPGANETPVYNLKVVLKETGLTADVLRAWERRYHLPKPQRTSGGHRLYSDNDIETVKWLRARQVEGLSISRAVELWREIHQAGRDPLAEYAPANSAVGRALAGETPLDHLRGEWVEACLAFDGSRAEEILNQAFAMYPVEMVCTDIIQQGVTRIGSHWYLDRVTVQQEHFASEMATRRLEALITAAPRPSRKQTVLISCPPGEWHIFPVLLLNLLLRRRGLNVVYLGANTPIDQLAETAAVIRPALIVLAAQQLTTAAALRSMTLALQGKSVALAYGGLIFNRVPDLRKRIPAYFLGESLEGSINRIERLLLALEPLPAEMETAGSGPELANGPDLARVYREKRPLIEIHLRDMLRASGLRVDYLTEANAYFSNMLAAALDLGDPTFLEADIEWVTRLLAGHQVQPGILHRYLTVYSQAIRQEMGETAAPITNWMEDYLRREAAAQQQEGQNA